MQINITFSYLYKITVVLEETSKLKSSYPLQEDGDYGLYCFEEISEFIFAERKHLFSYPDLVIYHPGHYAELNDQIIHFYKQEGFSKITLSSAPNRFMNGKSEYEMFRPILVEGGIPENDIIHITKGSTIDEIVRYSFQIPLQQSIPFKNVLLVGKAFFMRRFLILGEKYAPEGTILDVMGLTDDRGIEKSNWADTEPGKNRVIGELERISCLLRGTIS
ncbi:ElyC/SanA/YdcF family protein [Brevibacillus sp. 179-C9.3 HS]|uniref:ElyC/SanA/YdcF family protein n=1 Tax=unclassified Brevibacillus TaxID=2684853 RepID=UPI0039A1C312